MTIEQKHRRVRDLAIEVRRLFHGLMTASSKQIVEVCDDYAKLYERALMLERQLQGYHEGPLVNPIDSEL